jgi:type II secretory ATPase GspE/PulE/Tfp pilus assembly ATPase PilB-like protein
VRFRVDGRLHDRLCLNREWARPCVARLKVLAQLDLAQSRLPQDGRAQVKIGGRRVDLRIATTPTVVGESAVVRILDGGRDVRTLHSLDLETDQLDALKRMIEAQDGMVLATGPTGSGKTTTLYALLQELNTSFRKIITLEDPVENQLDGISQMNVNVKAGLTFARGLRSILRQDPDVVLVGEMRDEETARIGIQAALTGHLMLSTLHTRGTVESITRLLDMGIESYLLADTLRGIVAQRLVRRICINCKKPVETPADTLIALGIDPDRQRILHQGEGCDACNGTGYRGRVALMEILLMSREICDLIRQNQSSGRILQTAEGQGMHTLRTDAIRKVEAGITTVSEALSLVGRSDPS